MLSRKFSTSKRWHAPKARHAVVIKWPTHCSEKITCLLFTCLLYTNLASASPATSIPMSSASIRYSGPLGLALSDNTHFGLNLQRIDTDWLFDNNLTENRIGRIFISYYERPYPWFRPGLKLGYINMTQTSNPVTTGARLAGEMFGFSARIETEAVVFHPHIDIDYIYHQMETSDASQNVSLSWFEFNLKAGFLVKLGVLHLSMGAYLHSIDGDETSRGAITQTRQFKEDEPAGGFVDLKLHVDATGTVSLQAESGGRSSVNLVFAREF